jgi:hypothetical protein
MHNMPIDFIAAALIVCVALQALSILLENLQIVARQIEASSTWTARDGTVFEEVSLEQVESSQVMQNELDPTRSEFFRQLVHANG